VQPPHAAVQAKISQIQAEMQRIGMWQEQPPAAEPLEVTQAFGGDKLSFEQWLQFVFLPRVREIIDQKARFPSESQVSTKAFREWRMFGEAPDVDRLLELLGEFDALFG
jgi:uncharacterized protein YqcC (DUF446 family)